MRHRARDEVQQLMFHESIVVGATLERNGPSARHLQVTHETDCELSSHCGMRPAPSNLCSIKERTSLEHGRLVQV